MNNVGLVHPGLRIVSELANASAKNVTESVWIRTEKNNVKLLM